MLSALTIRRWEHPITFAERQPRGRPEAFISQMLAELRVEFFQCATEKQFFQRVALLKEAICYPARYLNDGGAKKLPRAI